MPDAKGPIPYIDTINAGLGQVLTVLPALMAAYTLLHGIWSKVNPEDTSFETFNKRLLKESTEVGDFTGTWLTSHGYTQQPDGSWKAPS